MEMELSEIKVLKPQDVNLNDDNYLVKLAVDFINARILTRDFDNVDGEIKIEVGGEKFNLPTVLDRACYLFNQNGWEARHSNCYSSKFACPTHAIFIKPIILFCHADTGRNTSKGQ